MADQSARRSLYQPFDPYDTGVLKVDDLHTLYYEQSGNPKGQQTAIVLHGGPGGGVADFYRQYFDPTAYRVVMFDQRGAGKSTPSACLERNTTWDLVSDIEKLRAHLGIEKWVVFGGSWGSTLALAYAETHPTAVSALVLRGIFMLRRHELLWFYQEGASFLFPDAWEKFLEPIPEVERHDLMSAYHRRVTGSDQATREKCALAWTVWEMSTSRLYVDPAYIARSDDICDAFARIETHYFVNGGFFKTESQLLDDVDKIRHIPTVIVQGRYDVVCPMKSAWDLHRKFPEAELVLIPDAGHSCKEPGIIDALVKACDKFRQI